VKSKWSSEKDKRGTFCIKIGHQEPKGRGGGGGVKEAGKEKTKALPSGTELGA